MNKEKKKHGFWFYFGRVMAGIGIALLLPILYIYLSVPTYSLKNRSLSAANTSTTPIKT